jgi:cysteine desulfurase
MDRDAICCSGTQRIYLDNNATTRPLPEVVEEVARCQSEAFANPGSPYAEGQAARKVLEGARESLAKILGARPDEVIFTSGGTESINLAVFGLVDEPPGMIALTAGEHPAVMESCRKLQRQGWKLHVLEVDATGRLIEDQFAALPWKELRLVTVILAHNETGVIQNMAPLAELCRQHVVPLHIDAVQAVGKIPVDFQELGATALSLGAHKFHGPRGIGALLLRKGTRVSQRMFGGHQERGRRAGTEPVALIAGMVRALELWDEQKDVCSRKLRELRDRLEDGLRQTCAPVVVNGSTEHRLPNTLSIAFPGLDGEALLAALDLAGIACSLGSACASGSAEPSPVLVAMGCPEEVQRSTVRFSLSIENSSEEIEEALRRIETVTKSMRALSRIKV